jgi:glycosyltransferase involved in cell wall biosynthesis
MRILITTTQVPFIRGGAELHAEGLREAFQRAGHEAEIVAIPFKWYPPEKILDHILACRLLDLSEVAGTPVDLLVGLKFPAYLIPHPRKVVWVLHQHRTAYELWDHPLGDLIYSPDGQQVRDAIRQADVVALSQVRALFTNSGNVAHRLKTFCGLDSTPLYHPPPGAEKFYSSPAGDYLFFPSRLCRPKRQELVIKALASTRNPVRVRFAGVPDTPGFESELTSTARQFKVANRIEWLGPISEQEKARQYAESIGVIYPPIDEDYGYVTLEAMLSSKPVLTCTDSGGPLEFVTDGTTGLVAAPEPEAVAAALDRLWENRSEAAAMGAAGRQRYSDLKISWENVVRSLLS